MASHLTMFYSETIFLMRLHKEKQKSFFPLNVPEGGEPRSELQLNYAFHVTLGFLFYFFVSSSAKKTRKNNLKEFGNNSQRNCFLSSSIQISCPLTKNIIYTQKWETVLESN